MIDNIIGYFTFNIFGVVVGLFGIAISIYTYIRTRDFRKLYYRVGEVNSIDVEGAHGLDPRIEIFFSGKAIERITVTSIWIWNGGNRTISLDDIARRDPLRISIPGDYSILDFGVISSSSSANNPYLSGSGSNDVGIEFDFLDKNQGFKCKILHTAPRDSVEVLGTVKSVGGPRDPQFPGIVLLPVMLLLLICFSFASIYSGIYASVLVLKFMPEEFEFLKGVVSVLLIILAVAVGMFIYGKIDLEGGRRSPPKSLDP